MIPLGTEQGTIFEIESELNPRWGPWRVCVGACAAVEATRAPLKWNMEIRGEVWGPLKSVARDHRVPGVQSFIRRAEGSVPRIKMFCQVRNIARYLDSPLFLGASGFHLRWVQDSFSFIY